MSDASAFINKAGNMAIIDNRVKGDKEFSDFCTALGLPPNTYHAYYRDTSRAYMAVRMWLNYSNNLAELAAALRRYSPILIRELGLQHLSPEPASVADSRTWRNRITAMLCAEDKSAILMAAGVPAGTASCVANASEADFWAKLQQMGKESAHEIWNDYPACQRLLPGFNESFKYTPPQPAITMMSGGATKSVFGRKKRADKLCNVISVGEPIDAVLRVTSALDHSGKWLAMMEKFDIEPSEAVARRIMELKEDWKQGNSPSRAILRQMCDENDDIGAMPVGDFISLLIDLGDASVTAEAVKWAELRGAADDQEKKKKTQVFDAKLEITEFLLKHQIATPENVGRLVDGLARPEIGVSTVKKLHLLDKDDLIEAGFSRSDAKLVLKVLESKE